MREVPHVIQFHIFFQLSLFHLSRVSLCAELEYSVEFFMSICDMEIEFCVYKLNYLYFATLQPRSQFSSIANNQFNPINCNENEEHKKWKGSGHSQMNTENKYPIITTTTTHTTI